jgi:hypothetical protein
VDPTECNKQLRYADDDLIIGEFLEWYFNNSIRPGSVICNCCGAGLEVESINNIQARYHHIDLTRLSLEKKAILESLRSV